LMFRPIHAAVNPLPQICKRSKLNFEYDASAKALAFVLR
jgi:hypothetical protein